ncbi:MAG TPA: hypothetical protein VJS30_14770, partial [Paraburkholderia sp.]|nr:hypothetical protein [Paraburkholderia sp.]
RRTKSRLPMKGSQGTIDARLIMARFRIKNAAGPVFTRALLDEIRLPMVAHRTIAPSSRIEATSPVQLATSSLAGYSRDYYGLQMFF